MPNPNEDARMAALSRLRLLDTPRSDSFDRITRTASRMFDLPMAAISLTDRDRQWFKSTVGIEQTEIPRDKAPCAYSAETFGPVVIPDMAADPSYADSPLANAGIRFYAGAPLITAEGHGLGTLCVLGLEPRNMSDLEVSALVDLAALVMTQIELENSHGRIDPSSGLSNRIQFIEDLDDLARMQPGERRVAVLVDFARTEQFDQSVSVMGSPYFDGLMAEMGQLLSDELGPGRHPYHVASTQFAFLAPAGAEEGPYASELIARVQRLKAESRRQSVITVAVGVAPFRLGQTSAIDLLRAAHSAAQDARGSETSVSLYSPASDRAHRRSFSLIQDFPAALDDPAQLRLVFQPRIDLSTRACVGAEALLRWRHPLLGDVSPGEFIPLIEHGVLAKPTTAWVIDHALAQFAVWRAGGMDFRLSVTVSASKLGESDFAQRVQLYLLKHRIRPEWFELEVTESAVMRNASKGLHQLNLLAQAGVQLAIDDFGTGHSSLAYLQRLPAHIVKIDQSFVRDLDLGDGERERERTLIQSMIRLSHDLGYRVVAEGIETAIAADLLAAAGCEEAQGFLFSRPLEPADFESWFRADRIGDAGRAVA